MSVKPKTSPESIVRDIKRKTRRKFTAEGKIRIVLMEIIRMVEGSNLSVKKTLDEMDMPRSTFYSWYKRYAESG